MKPFAWKDLPEDVAALLLKGSVGQQQLFAVADAALGHLGESAAADALYTSLAQGAMLAAWEGDVLNTACAHHALMLHEARPFLPPPFVAWGKVARAAQPPKDVGALNQYILQRNMQGAFRQLERSRERDPNNIFIVRQGIIAAFMVEDLDWAERWVKSSQALPSAVRTGILGDMTFARGQWQGARQCYTAALRDMPSLLWQERIGEAALRMGDTEACLAAWDAVLDARPWHTNLALRRRDVAAGLHTPGALPQGAGVILLYTYNKEKFIDATLRSLMESELGQTPVLVLNNGSSDGTAACINGWQERSGGQVRGIHLPCNVGAPAARNWLLTEPECRRADWLVYLDDDVQLPQPWLRYFGRAMEVYPAHVVYGCRVVNYDTPMNLQSVDLHIDGGDTLEDVQKRDPAQEPVFVRRFSVSLLHHQTPDFGDFSYIRPCSSVTGCCHLFRRDAIDAIGGFDLRFSPSQYDDLEHDIRHNLNNQWPVYQGHLRIRHMKQTGRSAMQDQGQLLASWGNLYKLQVKYSQEQYDTLRRQEQALLLDDICRR